MDEGEAGLMSGARPVPAMGPGVVEVRGSTRLGWAWAWAWECPKKTLGAPHPVQALVNVLNPRLRVVSLPPATDRR